MNKILIFLIFSSFLFSADYISFYKSNATNYDGSAIFVSGKFVGYNCMVYGIDLDHCDVRLNIRDSDGSFITSVLIYTDTSYSDVFKNSKKNDYFSFTCYSYKELRILKECNQ